MWPWSKNRNQVSKLQEEIAELRRQRAFEGREFKALREKLIELEDSPVVGLAQRLEARLPRGLAKAPKWIVAFLLTGALGSIASFLLLYWQTDTMRRQLEVLRKQLEKEVSQIELSSSQLEHQKILYKDQTGHQTRLLQRQDEQLERQNQEMLTNLQLQADSNQILQEQASLIEAQVEHSRLLLAHAEAQLEQVVKQIEIQEFDRRFAHRNELLRILYDVSDCELDAAAEEDLKSLADSWKRDRRDLGDWASYVAGREHVTVDRRLYMSRCQPVAPIELRVEAVRILSQLAQGDGIDLEGVDLRNARLGRMFLAKGNFERASFSGAHLESSNFSRSFLSDARMFRSALRYADFSDANLEGANLVQADLRHAVLQDATLSNAVLAEARLGNADLSRANLYSVNFSGADLSDAILVGAGLSKARLSATELECAKLFGADLSEVQGLIQDQLDQTCGDSNTKIPGNMQRPRHWLNRPWNLAHSGHYPDEAVCPGSWAPVLRASACGVWEN